MEFDRERFEPGFRGEMGDMLLRLERGLAALGRGEGGDPLLGGMARDAHTLRGSSKMMGHAAVAEMARLVEESLDRARAGGLAMGDARRGLLADCLSSLRAWLDQGEGAMSRTAELGDRAKKLFGPGAPRATAGKGRGRCRRKC